MAKKKKQTLKEFKAWLEGVEELQDDDWSPKYEQWVLIRDKINGIIEEKPITMAAAAVVPVVATTALTAAPSATGTPRIMPPPQVGGFPTGNVDMSPAAKEMMNPASGNAKDTGQ